MRNWFISFATTFTISALVITLATMNFSEVQVLHLALASAIIALYMCFVRYRFYKNYYLVIGLDLFVIVLIVLLLGYFMQVYSGIVFNIPYTLISIVVIYIIITLMYKNILTAETTNMNKKIQQWRESHEEK